MKKTLFLLIIFLNFTSFAQSVKKRLQMGNEFYKQVRVREVLDTMLWDKESIIFNNTEKVFIENGIDPENGKDYEFFQSNLLRQFLFSKRHILERVRYHYQHLPYNVVAGYVKKIKRGKRTKVIFESGLYNMLLNLIDQELEQIKKYTVPKYIEIIIKRHSPIPLHLKRNGKEVTAKDLDLEIEVLTNNADYRVVNILDKENNQLLKPDGYTYKQIQKIRVIYKGMEFEFEPDPEIYNLPRKLVEVKSCKSKYAFEEIPEWQVEIEEIGNLVKVKLTNVVESTIVKTKPVLLQKIKKDSIKN